MPTLNSFTRRLGQRFIPAQVNVLHNPPPGTFWGNVFGNAGMSLAMNSVETVLKTILDALAVNRDAPPADNPEPEDM
jgi:hypothetical protein